MSSERTTRRSLGDRRPTVDWQRVDALTDADIQAGIDADPDAAPMLDNAWLANARLVDPDTKVPVTIRLDRDIVSFFKDHGKGYQTRINQVLRAFVDHERAGRRTGN